MDEFRGYPTPEEAALADWEGTPSAGAEVIGTWPSEDLPGEMVVHLRLAGSPPYNQYRMFVRQLPNGTWRAHGGNG